MSMDNMILGENVVYSTDSSRTGLNNNVIVCGTSGCGKTMSVSEPCILETKSSSLICTVTKRKIVNKYRQLLMQRGYFVRELNFIHPAESDIAYDPLKFVRSYADIRFLAESIVRSNPKSEHANIDPYWDEAAISLLCAEIAFILMMKKNPTFTDVLNLHGSIKFGDESDQIRTSLDKRFELLEKKYPDCYAVSCWKSFHQLPLRTASCVFGTLNTAIDTIFSPELKEMIATKENVNFEQLASRKTVLFISTSAVNPALNCFINMFYAQAFKSLFEYAEKCPDGRLPIPVRVLCDDFATGSRILNFPEYISIFREKQISVILLLQSESQLHSMYGENDAVTIINNCDTYVYMGGMDLRTGRSVSERLNAPLEDILYMPIGQEIIFRRGQRPIITRRYNITKNAIYQDVTAQYEKRVRKQAR